MIITQFNDVFYKWGLLFANSLYFTNPEERLYMDTVNLDDRQVEELQRISIRITVANSHIDFPPDAHVPTLMANRRVKVMLDVLSKEKSDKYILIDADMLFRKPLGDLYKKVDDAVAAIIFRDGVWEGQVYEHLKVACGLVLITPNGIPLIEKWNDLMCNEKSLHGYRAWEWYWDQIALLVAARQSPNLKYASIEPDLYINRDFGEEACIWSANKAPKDHMYQMFVQEFEKMKGATNAI